MWRLAILTLALSAACGDSTGPADSAPDTGDSGLHDSATVDSGSLVTPIAPPRLPTLTPCPSGWRAIPHAALEGMMVCEPWPEGGPRDCAVYEAHFPGAADCVRIGSPCPSDGWPSDLPSTGVVHVQQGAVPGGDGTRAMPFATVQEGVDAASAGGTVAIGVGTYEGRVDVTRAVSLVGACAESVALWRDGVGALAIVDIESAGAVELRDLTIHSDGGDRVFSNASDVTLRSVALDGTGVLHYEGDLVLDEVVSRDYDDVGLGVINTGGTGDVSLSRVVVQNARAAGLSVLPIGVVSMEDIAIRSTADVGIQVSGSEVRLARVVIEEPVGGGVVIDGDGIDEDVLVRRVRRVPGGASIGYYASKARLSDRLRVEDGGDVSISLGAAASELRDMVVGTSEGGLRGRGIEVASGAQVVLERALVVDSADLAIFADGAATTLSLTDVTVRRVAATSTGNFGRCLHAQRGATVAVARASFIRCREAAVTASYAAEVSLRDTRVERTLPLSCEIGACDAPQAGLGLVALEMGGRIDAERFFISESALAGVQIVQGGEVDLRDGTIEDNPVGINVQVEGYDLARVRDRVVFRSNGVNLDSTELPVPEAMAMPGSR